MSDAMSDKHPYADLDAKFRETKARIIGYADLTDEAKALPPGQPGGWAMPLDVPK